MNSPDFPPIDFSVLNESDVREEIIAPLLRNLGYRSGTSNNIIREQSLRYPRAYIGRKNQNKDPLLRGKADYICQVGSRLRWIIEAKDPNAPLTVDEIEQAFSYAFHPEVRAVYFVLCNGKQLAVYATTSTPESKAIFTLSYEYFSTSFDKLQNILSPAALERDFPAVTPDYGKPLADGLRSVVRLTSGHITYHSNSLGLKPLQGLTVYIVGGAAERDQDGTIVVNIRTLSPHQSFQDLSGKLGLNEFELFTSDSTFSSKKEVPTQLVGRHTILFPQGEELLNLETWNKMRLPITLTCSITTTANGYLEDSTFKGTFETMLDYKETNLVVKLLGTFSVTVS